MTVWNPGYIYTKNGIRYAHVLGHPSEDYAYLVHNRFVMYSGRDSTVQEKLVKAQGGITATIYHVWISLEDGEYSHKDAEVALGILEKDKRKSGPRWDRYYSSARERNEEHY